MGIGQHHAAVTAPATRARIGSVAVRAGHSGQVPRRRAFRQHRRQRPVAALVAIGIGRSQLHRRIGGQLHLGHGGNVCAHFQVHRPCQTQRDRQHSTGGPILCSHLHAAAQTEAATQARACLQLQRLVKQGAGGEGLPITGGHRRTEHGAGRQSQAVGECHRCGQHGTGRQHSRFHRYRIVQRGARREFGTRLQLYAFHRHHQAATERCVGGTTAATLDQFPAGFIRVGGRWREAIVDAAMDVEVAFGPKHQRGRFAKPAPRRVETVGIGTVAVAGQVDVTGNRQVATGVVRTTARHHLHART
ncbi:hypothetical protein D3C71_631040 [compost metagenome]